MKKNAAKKESLATQVFALYCLMVALYLSIGGFLQSRWGFGGIVFNQVFFLALPAVLYAQGSGLAHAKVFPLRKFRFQDVLLVLLLTALVIAFAAGLLYLQEKIFPFPQSEKALYESLRARKSFWDIPLQFLVLALIPAFCEELFFRGLLQEVMSFSFGAWQGILLTALFFTIAHANPWYFVYHFSLGIYLGWLRQYRKNLSLCILAHLANNLYFLYS